MNIEKKLSALKDYVRSVADSDADGLIAEAEKRAEEIKKSYEETAKSKAAEILSNAEKRADTVARKEMSQSLAKTSRALMDAKNEILMDALERLRTGINGLADGASYANFLEAAAIEAIEAFGEKKIVVKVREKDRKFMEDLLGPLEKRFGGIEIILSEESADIVGGIVVESADGRVVIENTLENKFEEIKERFSTELFSNLRQ